MRIKSLLSFLSNGKGFSLTEIMVGGSVLAGVALAGAQLFKDQKFAQKRVEYDQQLASYHQNLAKILNIAANCSATFKPFYNTQIVSTENGITFPINTCRSNCVDNNANANRGHDASDIIPSTTPLITNNQWIDNSQIWQVTGAHLINPLTTSKSYVISSSGPVIVRVTYAQNQKITGVQRSVIKDIVLQVRFNNGGFMECVNKEESSVNNLQRDLCKAMNDGEHTTTSDGRLAIWNEMLQVCEVIGDKNCTLPSHGSGVQVAGIKANGHVSCTPIVSPAVTPALLPGAPTNVPCAPPNRPRLTFNTVTNNMVIQCAP